MKQTPPTQSPATSQRKSVAIGLLGPVLDHAKLTPERWERWRPTVSLCQQEDMVIDRLELLHQPEFAPLATLISQDIQTVSPETEVRLHEIAMQNAWDFEEVFGGLLDFARTYPFDPEHEDYFVHITTGTHVAQICLFLLTESRHIPGRLIQTSPPARPRAAAGSPVRGHLRRASSEDSDVALAGSSAAGSYSIIDLDLSRYDRLATRFQHEQREAASFLKSGIETRNAGFNALIDLIERVAIGSSAPILLTGPTGSGKSQLARRIYELKKLRRQASGSFVEVNCATLRGDGAMSALFGHKRGAFTGALQDRPGLLCTADKGILFLDEVGELGLDEQAMLLRAIEEKRFLPVGSDKETCSDFQLIAGTNRDLRAAVARGSFREDLLARLNLWTFTLPGLRERSEDIEPNLDYELEKFERTHGRRVAFNKEARQMFLEFACAPEALWSANFRDLNAAIVRMGTLSPAGRITTEVVRDEITRLQSAWAPAPGEDAASRSMSLEELLPTGHAQRLTDELDPFDRAQLEYVLSVCKRSRSLAEAGRTLFAASRRRRASTNDSDRLRKYLARWNLDWNAIE